METEFKNQPFDEESLKLLSTLPKRSLSTTRILTYLSIFSKLILAFGGIGLVKILYGKYKDSSKWGILFLMFGGALAIGGLLYYITNYYLFKTVPLGDRVIQLMYEGSHRKRADKMREILQNIIKDTEGENRDKSYLLARMYSLGFLSEITTDKGNAPVLAQKAITLCHQLMEDGVKTPLIYFTLGIVYEVAKKKEKAIQAYTDYMKMCPSDQKTKSILESLTGEKFKQTNDFRKESGPGNKELGEIENSDKLPGSLKCPNCGEELELDMSERIARKFTCPACGKIIDLTKNKKETSGQKEESKDALHNPNELDNWIGHLEFIPKEYHEELTKGLIQSLGPGEMKLACLCLKRPTHYFKTKLDENIKVRIRFVTTETPYKFPIIASYVKVFDAENPGVDEYFITRDMHLKKMLEQDHTYLIIADQAYKIYFIRKIPFDNLLREDLNKIKNVFDKYGELKGNGALGANPGFVPSMNWYQQNVQPNDIDRKYF